MMSSSITLQLLLGNCFWREGLEGAFGGERDISPNNVALDSTGAGAPFCDVLAGEWESSFMRVTFGGKASDKRVSMNSQLTGAELYEVAPGNGARSLLMN
jgi:hypothetical protein